MSVGRPNVNQSGKDPVTCTIVVSSLTNTDSWEAPVEDTVALGAGLAAGRGVVATQCGHVTCCSSPSTFTSSLKKESRNLWELGAKP